MVGPRGVAHTCIWFYTLILYTSHVVRIITRTVFASAISVLELAGRLRSGLSAHGAARPALIHQHSDSPSTGGRADRRLPECRDGSWQMHVLVACGRGTWDGGSIPCVLALPGANAMVNALAFPFCSTLCSTGESVRRGRDSPMTHEVHARASRDARVAARLEERRRVAASTISRPERKALCQFVFERFANRALVARAKNVPAKTHPVCTFRPRCTMRAQLFCLLGWQSLAHGGPWARARRRGPPCGPGFAKGGRARHCPAATASHLLPCCDRQP